MPIVCASLYFCSIELIMLSFRKYCIFIKQCSTFLFRVICSVNSFRHKLISSLKSCIVFTIFKCLVYPMPNILKCILCSTGKQCRLHKHYQRGSCPFPAWSTQRRRGHNSGAEEKRWLVLSTDMYDSFLKSCITLHMNTGYGVYDICQIFRL